jgi:hypothetical protein
MQTNQLIVAHLTVDEFVKLRVALNNAEIAYKRLLALESQWGTIYNGELNQVKEGKEVLAQSMQRENKANENH